MTFLGKSQTKLMLEFDAPHAHTLENVHSRTVLSKYDCVTPRRFIQYLYICCFAICGHNVIRACSLANSSHVWTVIMWCQSCAWSFHSGINQPWAAYRQINTSAGGQDGLADWQLILSVSRELRRNRTLPCCKLGRRDSMTFSAWLPITKKKKKCTHAHTNLSLYILVKLDLNLLICLL